MSLDWLLTGATGPGQWLAKFVGGSYGQCSSDAFSLPELFDLQVVSLEATPRENFTESPLAISDGQSQAPIANLDFCNVTVVYTHPGWNDSITVTTFLPTGRKWNRRLMAAGGGGFIAGGLEIGQFTMIPALEEGFAVTTTDGGHSSSTTDASTSWALSSPGNINWPLLVDFASVTLHDMSRISKALVEVFYGEPARYSYFYGLSNGGRQGHMLAQRYPNDFNGIIASMPGVSWTRFLWATQWPTFVMDKMKFYPRPCEAQAMVNAAIAYCDPLDGVKDGIVSRLDLCDFKPRDLVGQGFDCDGVASAFSSEMATVVEATLEGPRSSTGAFQWYGYSFEAMLGGLLATTCKDGGKECDAVGFALTEDWARYFVAKDADFNLRHVPHETWDELCHASTSQLDSVIGTAEADLSGFRRAGNKLLNMHGTADAVIPLNGSVDYLHRVLAVDPNAQDYYRFFVAPGASHSPYGLTPPIMKMMEIMVDWVEKGIAPETLPVAGENRDRVFLERDICLYPRVQHYIGGDMTKSSSFKCV